MTFFYNLSFARDNAVILFTSTHRKCQKLVNLQHIDFPNFISEVEVVNMTVVNSNDDYGTPVVFVEEAHDDDVDELTSVKSLQKDVGGLKS